jgi:hypothetical protein
VFCLGVTLAVAGQVAAIEAPGSAVIRFLVAASGIAVMVAVSALLSWYNSTRVSFRIVAEVVEPEASAARTKISTEPEGATPSKIKLAG